MVKHKHTYGQNYGGGLDEQGSRDGRNGLNVWVEQGGRDGKASVAMLGQGEIVALLKNREAAVAILVHHFRPLVLRTARQYAHVDFEEAIQEGYVALIEAIDGYDETLGVPFAGYVAMKVRGDVRTAMRRTWRYQERVTYQAHPGDSQTGDSVGETEAWDRQMADAAALDAWDEYDSADIRMAIAAAHLSHRERLAIHSMIAGETCAQLAEHAGVGTETAKTWRKRGLHKLRAAFGGEE
jgi:RNA polymerase sigma factor (sigma-70 family)